MKKINLYCNLKGVVMNIKLKSRSTNIALLDYLKTFNYLPSMINEVLVVGISNRDFLPNSKSWHVTNRFDDWIVHVWKDEDGLFNTRWCPATLEPGAEAVAAGQSGSYKGKGVNKNGAGCLIYGFHEKIWYPHLHNWKYPALCMKKFTDIERNQNKPSLASNAIFKPGPYHKNNSYSFNCHRTKAGRNRAGLTKEQIAEEIGEGLPHSEATGSMVVDIGGGTSEIAVMSLGGLVYSKSLRVAGDAMDVAIVNYMRKEYNLLIGDTTAEKIKKEMGTAIATGSNTYPVKGRDLRSGTPKEVNITEEDTAEALNDIMKEMVNAIKDALENTPPELSADLVDMGLTLTGGGALLKNIDKRFSKETGLPVHIADDPLSCVAVGTGKALDQEETFSTMLSEY